VRGGIQTGGCGGDELADLVADGRHVTVAQPAGEGSEKAVPCQRQPDGFPGPIVGPAKSFREGLAVVGEAVVGPVDDRVELTREPLGGVLDVSASSPVPPARRKVCQSANAASVPVTDMGHFPGGVAGRGQILIRLQESSSVLSGY